jgi:hypothetical protein
MSHTVQYKSVHEQSNPHINTTGLEKCSDEQSIRLITNTKSKNEHEVKCAVAGSLIATGV